MKSRILKTSIGSIIFLLLIIAVIALIFPVYKRVNAAVSGEISSLAEKLDEKMGIEISYESLSPSILAGIKIKNISLKDSETQKQLVKINRATFSYRLADFFSRTPVNAIRLLLLDGVRIEFDAVKDNDFAENIRQIFSSRSDEKTSEPDAQKMPENRTFTLAGRRVNIPFNVQFKNISFHYSDLKNDCLVFVKNVLLERTPEVQGGLSVKTSGRVEFRTDFLKNGNRRSLSACAFELSGNFFSNFEGSSFLLKLSEVARADYTLSKTELLLNYADSKLALRTMRSILPYSILLEADFEKQQVSFMGNAQQFEPLKLLKIRDKKNLYEKFEETKVSGTLEASALFENPENFVKSLALNLDAECSLPEKAAGSPVLLVFDVQCKDSLLTVSELSGNGENLAFSLNGDLNLQTLEPAFVFSLEHLILKNGGFLQTEVYVEPYKNGFMCFAPQLFMDDRSFTALELTVLPSSNSKSVDFSFEFDDYSHSDYEHSAHVLLDGSFINDSSRVLQASVSISDMFVDSVINTAAFFAPEAKREKLKKTAEAASQYIFSDEIYLTTDFKTFSFNSPYFLLANTQKERELLTFALDGSSQTITLSALDLQYGAQTAHATAGIDFSNGFSDFNFYTDLVINSLPYSLRGAFSHDFINVSGDYNFNTTVSFGKNVSGSVEFASLPLPLGNKIFSASLATAFSWNESDGIALEIQNFDIDEPYGTMRLHPHFAFTGSANKYGFVMTKLAYSDTASALDGKMNVVWSLNDGILDSVIVDLKADSILGTEKINLNGEFRNLERKSLTLENLKNDFYMNAQGSISAFPSARFLSDQYSENTINADFSVSGTLSNPFFSLNLKRSSVNLAGYPCTFEGMAVYDDTGFTLSAADAVWSKLSVSDFSAVFDPRSFSGGCSALLKGNFLDLDFQIPLKADLKSLSPDKNPAQNFIAGITSENMTGTFFPTPQKLDLTVTKTGDRIDFASAGGRGLTGSITNGQFITASAGDDLPLRFELSGSIIRNQMDLNVKNISADMKKFCQTYTIPYVNFTGGTLAGAVKITGLTTDPEYTGIINVLKPEFYIPLVSDKLVRSEKVVAVAGQGHFIVKPTPFNVEKNLVNVGLDIEFDRWKINSLDCPIDSPDGQFIYVDMKMPLVHYKGYGAFKDFLIHMTMEDVAFSGKIYGERGDIQISTDALQKQNDFSAGNFDYLVDLELQVKNKVQILVNPLLRGVIEPDNSLKLYLNTDNGDFSAKGEVNLRGGEIVWLNRSFYMKEGKVTFNETKALFDPRITVRAETRERDDDNNQVMITLSATNQALSQFNPRFSATPAKSEKEIMELLGQVISGNSQNVASLAMAGGDYLVQTTVMRSLENSLRELLNFDIFSIRTNILQNAVKKSFEKNSTGSQFSFGNFFDNSAVYVGKYFGSALYVDALMHWSYDETKENNDDTVNGLVFQPEFGFEMSSPFVNIRLGVAPDLEAIKNSLWIPSTSITLSWKHTF